MNAVVFLVDSCARDRFAESKKELDVRIAGHVFYLFSWVFRMPYTQAKRVGEVLTDCVLALLHLGSFGHRRAS